MLTVEFGPDFAPIYRNIAAITLSVLNGVEFSCAAVGCADDKPVRFNFRYEFGQTGRLLVVREHEEESFERRCIQAVELGLEADVSAQADILGRFRLADDPVRLGSGEPLQGQPKLDPRAGLRIVLDGNELLVVKDLARFQYAHITVALHANDSRLSLVASGVEKGSAARQDKWIDRNMSGEVVLLIEQA
jgi:hypothetical protein